MIKVAYFVNLRKTNKTDLTVKIIMISKLKKGIKI